MRCFGDDEPDEAGCTALVSFIMYHSSDETAAVGVW